MQRSPERRFHEIYERHREDVTLYVRRRVAADSVEDVVAETFLVCWRKLDQVPHEPLPWLYAVARKTLANHHRATALGHGPVGSPPAEDAFLPVASTRRLRGSRRHGSTSDRRLVLIPQRYESAAG